MVLQEIRKLDSEGKNRPTLEIECDNCKTVFYRQTRLYRASVDGCSSKCLNILKGLSVLVLCAHCNKEHYKSASKLGGSKSGLYFCSRECKDLGQKYIKEIQPDHYGDGLTKYRDRALKEYGAVCNRCSYSENIAAIVVHHKDHNRKNNDIDNLEVLCSNCHAIEHWGSYME